ncbi:hypothetical protein AB0M02_44175 [Actinoplanes sp. NPDC051861]|uniref:hypothetical protein n=1 Tax=Actinoplanes sp. NPDC051861 TaxID=3155170 RepID=UPI003438BB5D
MTIEPIDWRARLEAAVEKTIRDRANRKAERAQLKARRDYGLKARHRNKLRRSTVDRRVTCTVIGRWTGERCTAEPLDTTPEAEILICTRHAGLVLELIGQNRVTAPKEQP